MSITTLIGVLAITKDSWDITPFVIREIKFEIDPLRIWIRGDKTCWLNASQCHLGDVVYEYLEMRQDEKKMWCPTI